MKKHESIKFHQSHDKYGKLKSEIRITVPKEQLAGFVLVPKWLIVTISLIALAIVTTITASVVVIDLAPRPGLYQESCLKRSCIKNFGLTCKNNTCDCPTGYIYINKCIMKKSYMEKCHLTSYCEDGKNLVCLNGVCSCNSTQYWNGKICSTMNTFSKTCTSNSQCNSDQLLYCKLGNCVCNSNRY